MNVQSRLSKLEHLLSKPEAMCPKCGLPLDRSNDGKREFVIEWDDGSPPSPDEVCSGCGSSGVSYESRAHFVAIAARAMRQVLIDHARAKRAQKRGGENPERVTLSGIGLEDERAEFDAIDVRDELDKLAKIDERQAQIVEMRFFAGMTTKEIAIVLGVSEWTVELDWRMARAWLRREFDKGST